MNNISSLRQLYDTTTEIRLLVDMVVPDSKSFIDSYFRPKNKIAPRTAVAIACIFARRALPIVQECYPNDIRAMRAIEATEKWMKQFILSPKFSLKETVDRAHEAACEFTGGAKHAALAAAYCSESTQVLVSAEIAYKISLTAACTMNAIKYHYGEEQSEKEQIEECNIFRQYVPNPYS